MVYVYLIIAIVSEVFGTTFLKASQGFTVLLPTLAVVCGYGLAFYFLSLSLSSIPVGIAYAVWSGLGVVLISLMGWLVYGQRLDFGAMLGILLIVSGVVVLKLCSKMAKPFDFSKDVIFFKKNLN